MTNKALQQLQFRNAFGHMFRNTYPYISIVNDLKVIEKYIKDNKVTEINSKSLDLFYDFVLANGLCDEVQL